MDDWDDDDFEIEDYDEVDDEDCDIDEDGDSDDDDCSVKPELLSPLQFKPLAEAPMTRDPEVILPEPITDEIFASHTDKTQPETPLSPEAIAWTSSSPAPLAGETVSLQPVAVSVDHSPTLFKPLAEVALTLEPEVIFPEPVTEEILAPNAVEMQPGPRLSPEPIARTSSPPAPLAGETVSLPPVAVSVNHSPTLFKPLAEVALTLEPEVILPEPVTDKIPASHTHENQPEPPLTPEPIAWTSSLPAPRAGETVSLPPVAVSVDHSPTLFEPRAEAPMALEPEVIFAEPVTEEILAPNAVDIQPEQPLSPEPIARTSLPPAPLAGETVSLPPVAVSIDYSPPLFKPLAGAPVTLEPEVILPELITDEIFASHTHENQPEPPLSPEPIAWTSSPPAPLAGETVSLPPVAVSIDHSPLLFKPLAGAPVTLEPEVIFAEPVTEEILAPNAVDIQPEQPLSPEPIARTSLPPAPLAGETVSLPPVAVSIDHSPPLIEPLAGAPVKLEPEVILPELITDEIFASHTHENQPERPLALEQSIKKITIQPEPETTEQLDEDPEEPAADCFIATAVYGNPSHPDVVALRALRDNHLSKYQLGRIFIRFYWCVGPILASKLTPNSHLGHICRYILGSIVRVLKKIRIC